MLGLYKLKPIIRLSRVPHTDHTLCIIAHKTPYYTPYVQLYMY